MHQRQKSLLLSGCQGMADTSDSDLPSSEGTRKQRHKEWCSLGMQRQNKSGRHFHIAALQEDSMASPSPKRSEIFPIMEPIAGHNPAMSRARGMSRDGRDLTAVLEPPAASGHHLLNWF